jgi:hypothetical protein
MGQSHSSIIQQQQQHQIPQKRRSFLITTKKLIRLRKQTSCENSGAASTHDETTQTSYEGEIEYHKTADGNDVGGMLSGNQNKHGTNPTVHMLSFLSRSPHTDTLLRNYACVSHGKGCTKQKQLHTITLTTTKTMKLIYIHQHTKTSSFFPRPA